ncbi:hypothetical protein M422DRAFT_270124 [Sphaerobolus stellatus SS14]|uniref:Uncharacterized protein n=1 Tax=Sphaerobolus stellatus (strain SS14) TaxID=990650 RepID=A0A0C9U333_SPHS4|nr:hypothetical protein M422DRAFT_270124 [Sphaerobolus stellatus SS14]
MLRVMDFISDSFIHDNRCLGVALHDEVTNGIITKRIHDYLNHFARKIKGIAGWNEPSEPNDLIMLVNEQVETAGWNKARTFLSFTIRMWIIQAFISENPFGWLGNRQLYEDTHAFYNRAFMQSSSDKTNGPRWQVQS